MIRAVCFFMALAASPLAWSGEWTREQCLSELEALVARKASGPEIQKRRDDIQLWLTKLTVTSLDLGEYAFVEGVARYLVHDAEKANAIMLEYVREYRDFPDSVYSPYIGLIMLSRTGSSVVDRDYDTAKLTLPFAVEFSRDRAGVYKRIAASVRRDTTNSGQDFLNHLLVQLLTDSELSATAKQKVIQDLYGTRAAAPRAATPDRGKSSEGAKGGRDFRSLKAVDIDGDSFSISDYKGKVVLIDFWATWCGPCLRELPNVVATYKKYKDQGFEVVGISLDRQKSSSKVRNMTRRRGATWRQVCEGGGWKTRLAQEYGIRRIPATFLLDRHGRLRYQQLRGLDLERRVAELLKEDGPAPVPPAVGPTS